MLLINRAFRLFTFSAKLALCMVMGSIGVLLVACSKKPEQLTVVKVGILFSQTGRMSIQDKPIIDVIVMAINEINEAGGLLGHKLKIVTWDTASNYENYAVGAKELFEKEKVVVLFGCGNSVSRRNVRAVVEEYNNILVYPMRYEGGELSNNIMYVGPAPNQQLIPGAVWAMKNLGKRFFLVGTDAIYSHVANQILKDVIYSLNGEVLGEAYIGVNNNFGLEAAVKQITHNRPDVILNTIEGIENISFFKRLRESDITSKVIPTMSFGLTENALQYLAELSMEGDYSVAGFFQTNKFHENDQFEKRFYAKYGTNRAIDDPMVSIYVGIKLWAQAVHDAGTFSTASVLKNLNNQSYPAPNGLIYIDPATHGAYRPVLIGRIQSDQTYKIVWNSGISVLPLQYTPFKTPQEWNELIKNLYLKWGNQWLRK